MFTIKTISMLFSKSKKPLRSKLLAIFAHPDDESINIGGILAKAASEQIETTIVCLSKGEYGIIDSKVSGKILKKIREKELRKAASELGINKVICCDFTDSKFVFEQEKIKRFLERIINKVRPSVVITHDPTGGTGHPDHVVTSYIVSAILKTTKNCILYYSVVGGIEQLVLNTPLSAKGKKQIPLATHSVDIKNYINIKTKACLNHKSQYLASSKPIPLKAWYNLFDKEYLHRADAYKRYQFFFSKFETKHIFFDPVKAPSLIPI